jgi:TPR repeat protein
LYRIWALKRLLSLGITMARREDDFLSELILWRNNPALAEQVREKAEAGNVHAQYALGLMYAEGRGVKQDETQAYVWLSRAAAQGDQDAVTLRYVLLSQLNAGQITAAVRQLEQDR